MGIRSGLQGLVADADSGNIACIRNWNLNASDELIEYACSATKGAKGRLRGNSDWSGDWSGYGAVPYGFPGDEITLDLGIQGSADAAKGYHGPAVITACEIEWDLEGGKPISHKVEFGGNGELEETIADLADDESVPNPVPSRGTKLELWTVAASPALDVTLGDIRTVTLRFERDVQVAHPASGDGWPTRVVGNLSASIAAATYFDDPADLPARGSIREVRLYYSATEYYKLKWMIFGEQSGITVDREGGAFVGVNIGASLVPYTQVSSTPTEGLIQVVKTPPITIWPTT